MKADFGTGFVGHSPRDYWLRLSNGIIRKLAGGRSVMLNCDVTGGGLTIKVSEAGPLYFHANTFCAEEPTSITAEVAAWRL